MATRLGARASFGPGDRGSQIPEDDSNGKSWVCRFAGRRLKVPFTGAPLPTMSDWLSRPRGLDVLAPGTQTTSLPAMEGLGNSPPVPIVPTAPPLPSVASVPKTPLSLDQRPLTGVRPMTGSRPVTGTLLGTGESGSKRRHQHRQRVHPTMPRSFVPAMCRLGEHLPDELLDSPNEEWGASSSSSSKGGEGWGPAPRSDVFESCAKGVVIGPGSVFSNTGGALPKALVAGSSEAVGPVKGYSAAQHSAASGQAKPKKFTDTFGSSSGFSSGSYGVSMLSAIGSDEDGTLILPRVPALKLADSGSVATMHMGAAGAAHVLGKCRHTNATLPSLPGLSSNSSGGHTDKSAGGPPGKNVGGHRRISDTRKGNAASKTQDFDPDSPRTDRKWHIRQASLSAAVAQKPKRVKMPGMSSANAGTQSGNGIDEPTVPTKGQQTALRSDMVMSTGTSEKEYLQFEGWGIDDTYIRGLLQVVGLGKTRHINVSDNRLTGFAIELLVQTAPSLTCLESLRIGKNPLGDSGAGQLCKLLTEARPPLQELDLSECGIGDQACCELCDTLSSACLGLVGLSLAKNKLGEVAKVGGAIGALLSTSAKLQAIDLHWNNFQGLGAVALIQGLYENATQIEGQLWRVNLAWNRLGARCKDSKNISSSRQDCVCESCVACGKVVQLLASVFSDGNVLYHLDISYNSLRAADCAQLADGLRRNHSLFGLHVTGNEAQLDDIGLLVPMPSLGEVNNLHREGILEQADRITNLNCSVRHTPMGLRIDRVWQLNKTAGPNGGKADDHSAKAREMAVAATRVNPSLHRITGPEAFSEQDLLAEKEWVGVHGKVQRGGADFDQERHFEDVRINERCCWICENWVEEMVSYIPGWSGPEKADEVLSIYAYFSIDGFAKPTRLTPHLEKYHERLFGRSSVDEFGADLIHRLPEGDERKPIVDEKGRYLVYRGYRMLPPSTDPVRVLFQVNNSLVTAGNMPKSPLFDVHKVQIKLHHDGRDTVASGHASTDLPPLAIETGTTAEVRETNVIQVGLKAWDRFERGVVNALCLMEDPRHRGDLKCVPRRLQHATVKKTHQNWRYETSIFKDFQRETDKVFHACFEFDWSCSKLEKSMGKRPKEAVQAMIEILRKNYKYVCAAFHGRSLQGFLLPRCSAGLSLLQFTEILNTRSDAVEPPPYVPPPAEGETVGDDARSKTPTHRKTLSSESRKSVMPAKPVIRLQEGMMESSIFNGNNGKFRISDGDTVFIAANVVDRGNRLVKEEFAALPNPGLARFQFLEAIVRAGFQRFLDTGEKDTLAGAVEEMLGALNLGAQQIHLRSTLQTVLFCEECDVILRQRTKVLEAVFTKYRKRQQFPGRNNSKLMSYAAWIEFMTECDPSSFGVGHLEYGLAFAIGREKRVDEYTTFRHMELSWAEFLVCIGAVVRLNGKFDPEQFADHLIEFIEDYVSRASKAGRSAARHGDDVEAKKLVELVTRVFNESDSDGSGCLTHQELKQAFRQKSFAQAFKELGFHTEDFKVLFKRVDTDGSGDVTLDELSDGMVKMKKAMAGVERGIAFLRKAFDEADDDKSGFLTREEFKTLLETRSVVNKLESMGISTDDVDDIWAAVDANDYEGKQGVTSEEMVSGLLTLREPSNHITRGVNFVHQVFKTADLNRSGTLTPEEVEQAFLTTDVQDKLESLDLEAPNWLEIFKAVDLDGDGELSWEELSKGLHTIWEQSKWNNGLHER